MTWEAVIGLEIHAQLATRSKLFSSASTAYGAPPNTQACAVDVAMPGVLPVLNREAVAMAIKFGLAIGAQIAGRSIFARKNYFYPDLPKGYQISQYETPVVAGGGIRIELADGNTKSVRITRAHLEEDAGKSLHEDFEGFTGIDLNRAGTPLLEIVSEPELRSPAEAAAYMRKVHSLVRYLDICDGNMQEGSFRCDANVSVRRLGDDRLGTRTELKNINSFRFVEKAIELEIERQIALVEAGGRVRQETLLYDADRHQTRVMRGKEEANDYRYFPDPDLLPLVIDPAWIARVRASMPELPDAKTARFMDAYGLRAADAAALTVERDLADYFEAVAACVPTASQLAANWVIGELTGALNRDRVSIQQAPIRARDLGRLLQLILDATISGKIAKEVLAALWTGEGTPDEIVERRGLTQMSDASALEAIVAQVIADNPAQLAQYRAGKDKLFGFFVGQVMRETRGKANPAQVNELLGRLLRS